MTIYHESNKVHKIDAFFCPKCKKEKIKHEDVTPKVINRMSMDILRTYYPRLTADPWMGRKMKATCLNCGYSVEYEKMF